MYTYLEDEESQKSDYDLLGGSSDGSSYSAADLDPDNPNRKPMNPYKVVKILMRLKAKREAKEAMQEEYVQKAFPAFTSEEFMKYHMDLSNPETQELFAVSISNEVYEKYLKKY